MEVISVTRLVLNIVNHPVIKTQAIAHQGARLAIRVSFVMIPVQVTVRITSVDNLMGNVRVVRLASMGICVITNVPRAAAAPVIKQAASVRAANLA